MRYPDSGYKWAHAQLVYTRPFLLASKKGPWGMRLPACVLEAYSDGVMQTLDIQSNHAHVHMQLHTVTYYAA